MVMEVGSMYSIECRDLILINTDPQRRCYNGAHFSSEFVWSGWYVIDWQIAEARLGKRLAFWRDLNEYAVSQRGKPARSEFRAKGIPNEK